MRSIFLSLLLKIQMLHRCIPSGYPYYPYFFLYSGLGPSTLEMKSAHMYSSRTILHYFAMAREACFNSGDSHAVKSCTGLLSLPAPPLTPSLAVVSRCGEMPCSYWLCQHREGCCPGCLGQSSVVAGRWLGGHQADGEVL